MASNGKKSDLDFVVGTHAEAAIRDMQKLIDKERKIAVNARKTTAEAKKSQRAMQKAYKATADGADKAATKTDKVGKRMGSVGTIASNTKTNIAAWILSFGGIAGVAKSVAAVVASMQEVADLQKKFRGSAITREQITIDAAMLDKRGVSDITMQEAEAAQNKLAFDTGLPVLEASKIDLMAKSRFGVSQRATDSGSVVGQLAAVGRVPAEELGGLHNIFALYGAETKEQMTGIGNQLLSGYKGSSATAGEFLSAFQRVAPDSVAQGMPIEDTVAMLKAFIDKTHNSTYAAEQMKISLESALGKTEKQMEWYSGKSSKLGLDYKNMSNPDRVDFALDAIWSELESGNGDELKGIFDSAALRGLRVSATPDFQSTYDQTHDEIIAAKDSKDLQQAVVFYVNEMMGARAAIETNRLLNSEARLGREIEPNVILDERVDAILSQHKARRDKGFKDVNYDLRSYGQKRHQVAEVILQSELGVAYDQADTDEQRAEIQALQRKVKNTLIFDASPKLQREVSDITGNFGMVEKHGYLPYGKDRGINYGYSWPGGDRERDQELFKRMPATANYYGVDENATRESVGLLKQVVDKLDGLTQSFENALDRNTEAINRRQSEFDNPDGGLD